MAGNFVPSVASSLPAINGFNSGNWPFFTYPYFINGQTLDSSGNPLGSCNVVLYYTKDNSVAAITVSDANGNYSIIASPSEQYYLVAYLPGTPDVAGTTVNTLVAA